MPSTRLVNGRLPENSPGDIDRPELAANRPSYMKVSFARWKLSPSVR